MSEALYISKCLGLIEQKINRGSSQRWTPGDYKILQKAIFEASSINLSTYTLERLYGKLKIHKNYNPQLETKNALSKFLGYVDWEDFKNQNPVEPGKPDEGLVAIQDDYPEAKSKFEHIEKPKRSTNKLVPILAGVLIITGVAIAVVVFSRKVAKQVVPKAIAEVRFKAANPLGLTVPHTVKFVYDLSEQKGNDFKLLIPKFSDTMWLSRTDEASFYTLLMPGSYTAYLSNNNKVIAQSTFFAGTSGWRVDGTMHPHKDITGWSLPQSAVSSGGSLYTSYDHLHEAYWKRFGYYFLSYYNIQNYNVEGDNCMFETRFRNKSQQEQAPCNDMWFKIIGLEGVLKLHFLTTGCSGFINMTFGEKNLRGDKLDLAQFGVDIHTWKKARLEVVNKTVSIYLDDNLIYETKYAKPVGPIVGIEITSRMHGETDYVKLYNGKKELIYEDDFGGKANE